MSKPKPKYEVSTMTSFAALRYKQVPPWMLDLDIKPIGYKGQGICLSDFWSNKMKYYVLKQIRDSKVQSRISKQYQECVYKERLKHIEQKSKHNKSKSLCDISMSKAPSRTYVKKRDKNVFKRTNPSLGFKSMQNKMADYLQP